MVSNARRGALPGAVAWLMGTTLVLAGCGIPQDPEGSLDAARNAELAVGAAHSPPWVTVEDGHPSGPEVELVEEYAARIGAEVAWTTGSESALVGHLHDRRLDVVIGGFDEHTVWEHETTVTRPYATPPGGVGRVMLVELGENALLHDLESHFITRGAS